MPVTARLLGVPGLDHGGVWIEPAPGKTSALLYHLAHRGGWVSRDELLGLFWPDHEEVRARSSFRQMLTAVRRLPYTEGLEIERTRLRWSLPTDVAAFRDALGRGRHAEADALYRGALLEGFRTPGLAEFESWLQLERDLLQAQWREAALACAAEREAAGEHPAALGVLERLRRAEPFDEEALRAQIRCLAASARGAEAIAAFEGFERLLREELASEPSPATRRLIGRLRSGGVRGAVERGEVVNDPRPLQARLPTAATPFVGRRRELREMAELLADPARRLVTVVGPGGIGKTRLALEAARTIGERYRDGAAFVPLGAFETIGQAPAAIALALGLILTGDDPLTALIRILRDRELLLVLDNLEQFAGFDPLHALLDGVPGLQLLVTSRRRLDLRSEWLFELGGLASRLDDEGGVEDGEGDEALALFVQAARRVRTGFALAPGDIAEAQRVVRAVAGMPLALELAAGWLRTLALSELADEVEGGLDQLRTGAGDAPARHRSVRAAFDLSRERLDPELRAVLPRFAPFRGGFDREAAVAVTGGSLVALAGLVDRSLVQVVAGGRFDLHPLMAEYLRERLTQSGELDAVRERHGLHYLDLLERLHGWLWGRTGEAFVRWSLERENIRAAWLWAVEAGRADRLRAAVLPLATLCKLDTRAAEGHELLEVAGERFAESLPALEGALLIGRADLETVPARFDRAARLARRGLTLLRGADPVLEAIGEVLVGAFGEGRARSEPPAVERALARIDRLDEPHRSTLEAQALHRRQFVMDARGDREGADRLLRRMHDLYLEVGYGPGIAATTLGRGWSALYRGAYREAELLAIRGAEVAREHHDRFRHEAEPWMIRSRAAYGLGRFTGARVYALRSVRALERTDALSSHAIMLASAGRACARLGAFQEGEQYLRDALALGWEMDRMPQILLEAIVYLAELRAEQGRHRRAAALAGAALAHPLTRAWNREQAEALATKLAADLDAVTLTAALCEGERLDLERLVEGLMVTLGDDPAPKG